LTANKGPCYDLETVKRLVSYDCYYTTSRVRKYLINHGYVVDETVSDVIQSIQPSNYYKSDELHNRQGVYADIYRRVKCHDEEWYVKLFINEDGSTSVSIWSLKEDGYQY